MTKTKVLGLALAAAVSAGLAVAPRPRFSGEAASGQVLEGLKLSSEILGRDVAYAVYLPPDYATSTRRYPVVYLLHGYTDDESGWIQFGEVNLAADRAIAEREIPPMIIVMPDGGVTFYINDAAGKVRYEDMFVQELIPYIDATYRTRPSREFRGSPGCRWAAGGRSSNRCGILSFRGRRRLQRGGLAGRRDPGHQAGRLGQASRPAFRSGRARRQGPPDAALPQGQPARPGQVPARGLAEEGALLPRLRRR